MMTARVLNSNATLNSFKEIESLEFVPGTQASVVFRLYDTAEENRYIPPTAAVVKVTFNKIDGTELEKTASINADDRSICTVDLTEDETSEIYGGNALLTIDLAGDGAEVLKGLIYNMLRKQTIDS